MIGTVSANLGSWYAIRINDPDGNLVVGIKADGSAEYGIGFTAESSAKIFWKALGEEYVLRFRETERLLLANIEDERIAP